MIFSLRMSISNPDVFSSQSSRLVRPRAPCRQQKKSQAIDHANQHPTGEAEQRLFDELTAAVKKMVSHISLFH